MKHQIFQAIEAADKLLSHHEIEDAEVVNTYLVADGTKWCVEYNPFMYNGEEYCKVVMSDTAINDLLIDPTAPNDYFAVCVLNVN